MSEPSLVRRLTTIMDIDVVGFSAMSARDEEHALELLAARMSAAQALVKDHRGRVFKLTGDGLLAEFASPVEAVRAALEIQEAMRSANAPAGPNDQLVLRIGVNLGDVVESGDDLMGDAVNVAARLESIARPGGICVAAAVYEQIEGKLTLGAEDMGEQHVKNIPRAIHAYLLTIGNTRPAVPPAANRSSHLPIIVGGLAIVAIVGLSGAWLLHERSEPVRTQAQPPAVAATAEKPAPPPAPVASVPAQAPAAVAAAAPAAPPPVAAPPLAPGPALAASRVYSAADVPFVPDWQRGRLEDYARADGPKAMAVNARGWFAMAVRRIDAAAARRAAMEECNALVKREVPILREFDHCMIYALGNDVVWPFLPPPMPPPPYIPTAKLSPPVMFDPATVPLTTEAARKNLAEHYMKATRARALVLGHGHLVWWSPSDSVADAIRRNLQTCGHIRGRPCVVYALDDQVIVRVPQLQRAVDIFTPEALINLDPGQQAAIERYLIADDWRAIAVASNGRLGIVSGRASENAATSDAISECTKAGGTACAITAVGPFLVAPK
jgi:adenylate cyclase